MKKGTKLIIEFVGFFILLILGALIINDVVYMVFGDINPSLSFLIRFIGVIILILIIFKTANFGRDIDNFLKDLFKIKSK